MARPKVAPREQARRFDFNELFFSTTDRKGVILSGNEVFARVAGYGSVNELIGQPHNIIRHPDMPRAVFKLLWDTLNAGEPFAGFVKNLAADGCYYWVMAMVAPIAGGYLSVRFKPSSPFFEVVKKVYVEMLAIEREEADTAEGRRIGMEKAAVRLGELLAQHGFANYSEFMCTALAVEIESRHAHVTSSSFDFAPSEQDVEVREILAIKRTCITMERQLNELFKHATSFLKVVEQFDTKAEFLRSLAHQFHLVSLNGIVSSEHLNSAGAALSVVTQNLAEIAQESKNVIDEMIAQRSVTSLFRATLFAITAAKLQVETALFFIKELLQARSSKDAQAADHQASEPGLDHELDQARLRNDLDTLVRSFAQSTSRMLETLPKAQDSIDLRERLNEKLTNILQSLSIASLAGKVQAVQAPGAEGFLEFFNEVNEQIRSAKRELTELDDYLPHLQSHLPQFQKAGGAVAQALNSF